MKRATLFAPLLMIVSVSFCSGQSKAEPSTRNTKSESKNAITHNGPSDITRNIIQDRTGNIWAASWEGVFRYDGKSFTNITRKVTSARFFSALEDGNGNFWFGTIGSGIFYCDGKFLYAGEATFRNFTTKDGLVNNEVTCLYEDKAGNIWVGVNGGVSRYDGKSFRNYDERRPDD